MKARAIAALLTASGALAACHSQSSIEHLNEEQAAELNAIAANTSDTAGAEVGQNGARDMGEKYRSGAKAPPLHH
jgi:hypothetical protein